MTTTLLVLSKIAGAMTIFGIWTSHTTTNVSFCTMPKASLAGTINSISSSLLNKDVMAALVLFSVALKSTTTLLGMPTRSHIALTPKQLPRASISILVWPIIKTLEAFLIKLIKESARTLILTLLRFS